MNPNREELLFQLALMKSTDDRAEFLARECRDDAALRQRIEALLAAHEQPEGLLEEIQPVAKATMKLELTDAPDETVGQKIGRYKILEKVGEGGCGVVYVAEQTEPVRRRVALKVIKLGMDTKQVVARFEAERQALAMMDHPNIAKVLDAGTTDTGRPYFIMELVRGIKLTEYCDQNKMSTKERLELFIQICHAIQHAHQKGIIHRDIKPSNILVTLHDGVPVPKVIDFGIAKATEGRLTDATVYTQLHQFIGTPAYMSPEQAEMSGLDVDTRSDIYSLGVLLYELLTGRTPFDGQELISQGVEAMRRTIREKEPSKPSTRLATLRGEELTTTAKRRSVEVSKLAKLMRGDLDWIVMKCLEKDRTRRYETANGLAVDLKRHLNNDAVTARPPSSAYRFQKLVRRNKLAFAAAGAIALALLLGIVISVWQAVRATQAKRDALAARQQAESNEQKAVAAQASEAKLRERAEADEKKAETEATRSAEVAKFMKDMLKGVGPSVALGRDTKLLREILDRTAQRLGDLKDQPEVEADLSETLGVVYRDLSVYPPAVVMLQRSLELRRQRYGNENASVASALNNLAETFRQQKAKAEAEAAFREALAIRRKLFGEENLDVAASLYGLAESLRDRGDEKLKIEAEAKHREALAIRRKLLGNESLDVATSLSGLATILRPWPERGDPHGKLPEVEAYYREALGIQRRLLGNEHPAVAYTLQNLGYALVAAPARQHEAEALLREAVAMDKKLLGDSRDTIMAIQQLSAAVTNQVEAFQLRLEAVAMSQRRLGDDSPETEQIRAKLVDSTRSLLRQRNRDDEVAKVLREFAETGTPQDLNVLAWELATTPNPELRDGSNAVVFAEKAVALTSRTNAQFLDTLAAAYAEVRQFDKAVAAEQEVISLLPKDSKGNSSAMRLSLYQSSIPYRDHRMLAERVKALLEEGEYSEAEPLARECVALREKLIPDDWQTFNAQSMLGGSLLGQKKYAEAEPLLLSGYEGLKQRENQIPAAGKMRPKEALQRLMQLYEETNRAEQASRLKKELESMNPSASK